MEGMRQLSGLVGRRSPGSSCSSSTRTCLRDRRGELRGRDHRARRRARWPAGGGRGAHGRHRRRAGRYRVHLVAPSVRSLILLIAAFNVAFGDRSLSASVARRVPFPCRASAYGIMIAGFGAGAGSAPSQPAWWPGSSASATPARAGICPRHRPRRHRPGAIVPVAFGVLAVMGAGAGFLNVRIMAWLQARVEASRIGPAS